MADDRDQFAATIRSMYTANDSRLNVLLRRAREAGWTLKVLGQAIGITCEGVRVRSMKPGSDEDLPNVPAWPRKPPKPARAPKGQPTVPADTAERLRRLNVVARTVNGAVPAGDPKRRASEELSALIADLIDNQGVAGAEVARTMGVPWGTVRARMARHGYRKSAPSQAKNVYRNRKIGDPRPEPAAGRG